MENYESRALNSVRGGTLGTKLGTLCYEPWLQFGSLWQNSQ